MQIRYELTQKDFTEAYAVHRNSKFLTKWSRRVCAVIIWLLLAGALLGLMKKPAAEALKVAGPLFLLIALYVAFLWVLPWWSMRRQFLGQPGAHGPRSLTLDETGAHWRWEGGSGDIEWRNYIRSAEGKSQILLYTSPACFNILPKRAIVAGQLTEVRELLKQNIQTSR